MHQRGLIAAAVMAALAGCTAEPPAPVAPPPDPVEAPAPKPSAPRAPARPAPVVAPSLGSEALQAKYARIEQTFLTRDMLRVDGGGVDTPYTARDLARNFMKIALFAEYTEAGGTLRQMESPARLTRWAGPVKLHVGFGASVPQDQQVKDRNATLAFTGRLAQITGVPISEAPEAQARFHVLFLSEDDRRAAGPRLRRLMPGLSAAAERQVLALDPETYCAVLTFPNPQTFTITRAVAIIRHELPDRLRLSCIHEELAQAMGLPNDSPRARPSVFNDDEEFALLTDHDAELLRILYDPTLRPGMTAAEADPLVRAIAERLLSRSAALSTAHPQQPT